MSTPSPMQHQRRRVYQADMPNLEAWVVVALTEHGRMTVRELRDVLGVTLALDPTCTLLHRAVRAAVAAGKVGEAGGMKAPGPARPWTVWPIGGGA